MSTTSLADGKLAPEWTRRIARRRLADAKSLAATLAANKFAEVSVVTEAEDARWRKTIDFAKRHGLVPAGHRIEKQRLGDSILRIKLVPGHHANSKSATAPRIPIPRDLHHLHPCVEAIQVASDQLQIPTALRSRALAVLQGIATELERRGMTVLDGSQHSRASRGERYFGRIGGRQAGRIETLIDDVTCVVSVMQHAPSSADQERQKLVAIEIWPWPRQGPHVWVDGKRRRVEHRLGEVIATLGIAAAELSAQRKVLEQEQLDRQARWDVAMRRAKSLAIEERYLRILRERVHAWKFAQDLRQYMEAMRASQVVGADVGDGAQVATAWFDWAGRYLERSESLRSLPPLPDSDREPTPKELEPYLQGLSPYGR